jgi:hypothetical protein
LKDVNLPIHRPTGRHSRLTQKYRKSIKIILAIIKMGRTTTLFLLAFAIVSLYEVFTHDHEPGKHATVADDFEEFDEEKPKGSQMEMDNKISENFEDDDHLEIRPPTSSSPSQKVPLSFPPVKFSFWYAFYSSLIIPILF